MRAIRATVTGIVQGVGFRYETRYAAQRLGLLGWVRNRSDGTVETWAQGPEATVAQFVEYLRTGPRGAHVQSVDLEDVEPDASLSRFEVRF